MMRTHHTEELVELAMGWVKKNSVHSQVVAKELCPETNLLESGILDSLGLIGLIEFIERSSGIQIDLSEMDPDQVVRIVGLCGNVPVNREGE